MFKKICGTVATAFIAAVVTHYTFKALNKLDEQAEEQE